MTVDSASHGHSGKSVPVPPANPVTPAVQQVVTSVLDRAPSAGGSPRPAIVTLTNGLLKVVATNSDLSQILANIAAISGMRIEGVADNARVFGEFGPEDPKDVLNDLLVGSGFNYLMVGRTAIGTPRELRLSPKIGKVSPPSPASTTAVVEPETPGPGAILHVPPAPPLSSEERVQNNLKRLQQMHDSQLNPSQNNPNPPR